MTRSKYPLHLRSYQDRFRTACGSFYYLSPTLPFKRIAEVECKNCLKIIAANVETTYFKPRPVKKGGD